MHAAEPLFEPLCPECGDTTRPRGFCAVCERFWDLDTGADCPKHELPLTAHHKPVRTPARVQFTGRWVTLGRFTRASQALCVRMLLESEGIPTFLEGERAAGESAYSPVGSGLRLLVPSIHFERARDLAFSDRDPEPQKPEFTRAGCEEPNHRIDARKFPTRFWYAFAFLVLCVPLLVGWLLRT